MENNIDKVVTDWVEAPESKIPAEGQDCQGSVRLVTLLPGHGGSPKIIPEKIFEWNMRSQVFVVSDGCDIVKDELGR